LGEMPDLTTVSTYLYDIGQIWTHAMHIEILGGSQPHPELKVVREHLGAAIQEDTSAAIARFHTILDTYTPRPAVRYLQIASPLEVVVTALIDDVRPLAYVFGGMYAMERALRLLMDWQQHRADLASRRSRDGDQQVSNATEEGHRGDDREADRGRPPGRAYPENVIAGPLLPPPTGLPIFKRRASTRRPRGARPDFEESYRAKREQSSPPRRAGTQIGTEIVRQLIGEHKVLPFDWDEQFAR